MTYYEISAEGNNTKVHLRIISRHGGLGWIKVFESAFLNHD